MRVAHSAQAVVIARLVNQREFTRTAEAGAWNDDSLAGDGCEEPDPFDWVLVESGCNSG